MGSTLYLVLDTAFADTKKWHLNRKKKKEMDERGKQEINWIFFIAVEK